MVLGTLGSTLNDELNRLANGGTYRDSSAMVDEALAAKQWANRENITPYSTDTVGVLNEIAGLGLDKKNWLDFNGVCNYIAGTSGLPAAAALRQIYPTTDLLTGVAGYYIDATNASASGQTITNLGNAGSLLPTTVGSTTSADSNDAKFLDFTGTNYVYLPGIASNSIYTPSTAALQITGDIDVRVKAAMDDWTPTADMTLASKRTTGNISWELRLNAAGTLLFEWFTDGVTLGGSKTSTVATGVADGAVKWVRATLDVDNGASGNDVKFFTSDNGTTWTQLGSTVTTAGVTSIFGGTANIEIGTRTTMLGGAAAGKFYNAQIFNGIDGTKVLDVDTSVITSGADTYVVPTTYTGQAGAYFTGSGLSLNGVSGNYVSTPDANVLDITGDIDLQVKVALTDWTPASAQTLMGKWATGGNLSYDMEIGVDGKVYFYWTTNGSTVITRTSSVVTGITDGATKWVRATLDVDNGASGHDVKFYLSDDGTTWTQLGTTVTTAGTTSIYSGAVGLAVGANSQGNGPAIGTIYRAIVKSGIDGYTVFDADFTQVPANALRMTESSINKAVVTLSTTRYATINRSTSGRKTVAVTQPTWLFGTDDYMEVNNRYMSSGTYLYLPGVASNYASAPDSAALDITGDIDLRVKVAMDDWTPATQSGLLAKSDVAADAYLFYIVAGVLQFFWVNAAGASTTVSSAGITIPDGTTKWVRVTLDVDNGAGGNTATFFTSDDGITWTALGSPVVNAGVTNIRATTAQLNIGTQRAASNFSRGKFFRAQVLNGIGGTVAFDANFEGSITSLTQTTFTESSSNAATVTINYSGSAYRSAGITAAGYLYPGATNTFSNSTIDYLNFGATQSMTAIAVVRQWATPTSFGRYINRGDASSAAPGYVLSTNGTASTLFGAVYSPSGNQTRAGLNTITAGATSTLGFVLDRFTQTLSSFNGTTSSATASTSSVGSLENLVLPFRIGMANGTSFQDFELVGVAVFRSVLTAAQIRQITNYFANREVYL